MKYPAHTVSYYIISLGCAKNLVDSERLNGELQSIGLRSAPSAEDADIIIISTCGFIEDAKKESIDVIFDAVALKDGAGESADESTPHPREFGKRIAVIGCLTQRYGVEVEHEIPEIDFVYGVVDGKTAISLCKKLGIVPSRAMRRERKPLTANLPYRYIKISDGCSNNCSYCAIPLIRGGLVSYPPAKIYADARNAVKDGARELIVVAQDIASYQYETTDLAALVNRISCMPGVEWIRLMYCHPDRLDDSILQLLAHNDRVVKYIDLPFQHVSKTVLRSMGRSGDVDSYTALIERLRSCVPGIHIRSTFMVGYPGESESDFNELVAFLKGVRLERIGCFMYSPEEGTPAAGAALQVDDSVKRRRYRALMRLQKSLSAKRMRSMIGRTVRVLVEEKVDDEHWMGRTEYDAPEIDGIFYLTAKNIDVNTIIDAKVIDSSEYDLIGVLD